MRTVAMGILALAMWNGCSQFAAAQSTFAAARLQNAVERYIRTELQNEGTITDFEVSAATIRKDEYFSEKGVSAVFRSQPGTLRGSTNVAIEFVVGEKTIRKISIPATVKIFSVVPVAVMAKKNGQVMTETDIAMERREISAYKSDDILLSLDDIVGKTLRRPIAAGSIISASAILQNGAVRRGQIVALVVQNSGVVVRARGTTLTDGSPGETISVVRQGEFEQLTGILNEHGEVVLR